MLTPDGWLIVSSMLLQMSEVQAGGATVFTDIGASVLPKKVQFCFIYVFLSMLLGEYLSEILIVQPLGVPAGVSSVLV